jgi:hypothetical protein
MNTYSTDSQEHRVNIGSEADPEMEESLRDPFDLQEEYDKLSEWQDQEDNQEFSLIYIGLGE